MIKKILILGAGITGLTAGLLLRQRGFEVILVEKRCKIEPVGGGLGIWPNGVKVLMELLCAEKIKSLTGEINYDLVADANSRTLLKVPRALFLQVNAYPIMNVCRAELHRLLLDEFGQEHILFGAECVALQQNSFEVIAQFNNHQDIRADILVGADGIHSMVRNKIHPNTQLIYGGYLHFLGILRFPEHSNTLHNFIFGKNRYCLQFPISENRHMFYQVLGFPQGKIHAFKTRQERIDLFKGWSKEVDTLLTAYELSFNQEAFKLHFYCEESYYLPLIESWYDRRFVLIGDAAHPIGSVMGFGAGCGLEDAHILATSLQNKRFEAAFSEYFDKQKVRMKEFYYLEKKMTDFILNASTEAYNDFISGIKKKTPLQWNEALLQCLQA